VKNVTLRWLLPCSALFLFGPAASKLVGWLRATDGGSDVTFLANDAPGKGLLAGILVLALAMIPSLAATRTIGAKAALAPFALTLAWAAWFTTPIDSLARWQDPGGLFLRVGVENAILGLLGLGCLILIVRLGNREVGKHDPVRPCDADRASWANPTGALALAAGAVAAWALTWLVARDPMRGQSILAAFVAAIGAGAAGAWIGPLAGGKEAKPPSPLVPMASVVLVAVLGPFVALVVPGASELAGVAARGELTGPARLQAFDALLGAALGVPVGFSWVASVTAEEPKPARA